MNRIVLSIILIPHLTCAMSWQNTCKYDNVDELKVLIEKDRTIIHQPDDKGHLPIHIAAYEGSINVVRLLLDTDPQLVDAPDTTNHIPLVYVLTGISNVIEQVRITTLLCAAMVGGRNPFKIASPDKPDKVEDLEPLVFEEQTKKKETYKNIIALLISRNANLGIKDAEGKTWNQLPGINNPQSPLKPYVDYVHECIQKQ